MKTFTIKIIMLLCLFCINLNTVSYAGRQCTEFVPTARQFYHASNMALALQKQLHTKKVQLALVGRVGGDLSAYDIKYSHMGFLYKKTTSSGEQWLFVHELNECGSRFSSLYDQGMVNFFLDDLLNMDIVVLIPDMALQQKISALLKTVEANKYHFKNYNMIAHPFSLQYQNSNQWVLEVIAAAQNSPGIRNRQDAQSFLKQQAYQPQLIHLSPLKKMGAGMFSSHIHFDDHTDKENRSNSFQTVSVKSIINYLLTQNRVQEIFELSEQQKLITWMAASGSR